MTTLENSETCKWLFSQGAQGLFLALPGETFISNLEYAFFKQCFKRMRFSLYGRKEGTNEDEQELRINKRDDSQESSRSVTVGTSRVTAGSLAGPCF